MKKKTIVKISCALFLVFGVATCLMSKYELEDQAVLEDVVGMKLPKYSLKKYAADNTFIMNLCRNKKIFLFHHSEENSF